MCEAASTPVFTAAFATVAKSRKHPACPQLDEGAEQLCPPHRETALSQDVLPFATAKRRPSGREGQQLHHSMHLWKIKPKVTNGLTKHRKANPQTPTTGWWSPGKEGGGVGKWGQGAWTRGAGLALEHRETER